MALSVVEAGPGSFKDALASFTSGVTIITAYDGDGVARGMTASAFSSVSLDPLLVLICLHRDSRTYAEVSARGRFGVNILHSTAERIARHCSRPGGDKLLRDEWLADGGSSDQPPMLEDSLAYLDCSIVSDTPAGTHSVLLTSVGSIAVAEAAEFDPLVYFQGDYRRLETPVSISA